MGSERDSRLAFTKDKRRGDDYSMNEITQELKQRLEGTDDLSMAKGLAYALLETLTGAAHEISECLFRGETDAEGLLSVIDDNIAYVQHNTAMIVIGHCLNSENRQKSKLYSPTFSHMFRQARF